MESSRALLVRVPVISFPQEAVKMRTLSVAILLALFVPNAHPQSNPTLTVHVFSENEESKRITQAVSARIGSTTRYTIAYLFAQLSVDIMCFTMEKIVVSPATQGMDGYVCFYSIQYQPTQLQPFHSVLGLDTLFAGKFAEVVEEIFDNFVSETSDERLKKAREEITNNVESFCRDAQHKSICGQRKEGH
jgi:hypothetical protein